MGERLKKVKLLEDLKEMNVLGIIFDSKLQWTSQVVNTISKANSSVIILHMLHNDILIRIAKQDFAG